VATAGSTAQTVAGSRRDRAGLAIRVDDGLAHALESFANRPSLWRDLHLQRPGGITQAFATGTAPVAVARSLPHQ